MRVVEYYKYLHTATSWESAGKPFSIFGVHLNKVYNILAKILSALHHSYREGIRQPSQPY